MDNSTIRTGALLSCDVASFGGAEPFSEATEVESIMTSQMRSVNAEIRPSTAP